ncbi:hypothetical protein TNCV_809031 [Trichonephila clavipes]|nr:hypothetical protein TNCV_809031 [Trichonephila clavipes]
MGTTNRHRTWGREQRLVGENRDNNSRREEDEPDEGSGFGALRLLEFKQWFVRGGFPPVTAHWKVQSIISSCLSLSLLGNQERRLLASRYTSCQQWERVPLDVKGRRGIQNGTVQ